MGVPPTAVKSATPPFAQHLGGTMSEVKYWDIATQKYVNAFGVSLDRADLLPALAEQKRVIDLQISELQREKAVAEENTGVVVVEDGAPADYQGRKKWAKEHGVDVVFNISRQKLDEIVAELETK